MSDTKASVTQSKTSEQRATAPEPEAGGRLLLGWILILVGVVLLFIGWLGVSANAEVAVQLPYFVSGGLGGLLAGIVGVGLLVSDDVRKDRARLGRLEASVLELTDLIQSSESHDPHR